MNIIRTILSSVLSLALVLGLFVPNVVPNVYAEDNNRNNILEEIKNNDFVDIKKIELNDNQKEITSVNDVNTNSRSLNLPDGTYLIDRGYGWVLGNDKSFVNSQFARPNESLFLKQGKTVSTEHTILSDASAQFNLGMVKAAVELAYEHTILDSNTIALGYQIEAPSDKNIYVKSYVTYKRYDMIKIQNGKLKDHSATYEPNGTWAKTITYKDGETINQDSLKEKVARNVLGEPELVDIKNTIQVSGCDYVKNLDIVLNDTTNNIELVNRSNTPIHKGYGSQEYFSIELKDSNNKTKASMKMTGNDYSNDSKFDSFDKTRYEIGDTIRISHREPYLLNILGNIIGDVTTPTEQEYTITKDGLKVVHKNGQTIANGIYNISPKSRPSSLLVTCNNAHGNVLSTDINKNDDASKWKFEYVPSKDAYTIKNVKNNKFLTDSYYSMVIPNALEAISEPYDDGKYFKIEVFDDNKISMVSLKSGLAITLTKYGESASLDSINRLKTYTRSDEQKFTITKCN